MKYRTSGIYQVFVSMLFAVLLLPRIASAAVCTPVYPPENFAGFVCIIVDALNKLIPVLIGVALVVFFWGLAKFILRAGDEKGREEGKQVMLWGIISLFIMVSVFGIVIFLYWSVFNQSPSGGFLVPTLPTQ